MKDDDAALAKSARARFDLLKRDASAVAGPPNPSLRSCAMITEREWSCQKFSSRVATHPLVGHIARRLVWETTSHAHAFRIAEDGSFADARDEVFALDDASRVRVAHPARMSESDRAAWTTLFADYHVIQPFEQLARRVPPPATNATNIARDATIRATKILGTLESRGWRRNDRAYVTAYLRATRSGDARIDLAPGISMERVNDAPAQRITGVALPCPQNKLDPIDYAEITRDLDSLL